MKKEILIIRTVLNVLGVNQNILARKTRKDIDAVPRFLIHYFLKKYTVLPLADIGLITGGYSHDAVIYSCRAVPDRMEFDSEFRDLVNAVQFRLEGFNQVKRQDHNKLRYKLNRNG